MQFYYGEKNILRALDEAEFWKHHEAEHTVVIQLVTPDLEPEYVSTLKEFERSFGDAYGDVIKYIQSITRSKGEITKKTEHEILECIKCCILQSERFVKFLDYIMQNSAAVKNNNSAQTVIYHIIRESKYFIGIDRLILE